MSVEEYIRIHFITKVKQEILCEWCGYNDTYMVAKHDQVKCKKCNKFIAKNKNENK